MSLFVGDAGDSGISGNSSSSLLSSPSLGGAPRAADVRWRGLGLGASKGRILRDAILGGCSGRGAAAGVVGVDVEKVLTVTLSELPESGGVKKLFTVEISFRVAKSSKVDMASKSICSSSSSSWVFILTFLTNGETEWVRTTPLPDSPVESYPSAAGGAEGSAGGGVGGTTALGITTKYYTFLSHFFHYNNQQKNKQID